jgi:hypothetical protein
MCIFAASSLESKEKLEGAQNLSLHIVDLRYDFMRAEGLKNSRWRDRLWFWRAALVD